MKMIALCGAPHAGKTAVQKYLREKYDVAEIDDGWPMRDFAMRHLGLSSADVYSADGKAKTVTFPGGQSGTVRWALGEIGVKLTELLGPDAIPEMAFNQAMRTGYSVGTNFSFGSVRQNQANFFKKKGAKIVEVVRPGFDVVNTFDRYNTDAVDITLFNSGSLERLHNLVDQRLGPWLRGEAMS